MLPPIPGSAAPPRLLDDMGGMPARFGVGGVLCPRRPPVPLARVGVGAVKVELLPSTAATFSLEFLYRVAGVRRSGLMDDVG